ncbi:hypothetical protein D3C86_1191890 [compost metagenome]
MLSVIETKAFGESLYGVRNSRIASRVSNEPIIDAEKRLILASNDEVSTGEGPRQLDGGRRSI